MARQYDMLSFGVLLVIVAMALIASALSIITDPYEVIAVIIALYGIWIMVLAGIRSKNPEKYGRGAYSTLVMGVLLAAIGGAWLLSIGGINPIITIALLLVVIGILAVASALPSMRQK